MSAAALILLTECAKRGAFLRKEPKEFACHVELARQYTAARCYFFLYTAYLPCYKKEKICFTMF